MRFGAKTHKPLFYSNIYNHRILRKRLTLTLPRSGSRVRIPSPAPVFPKTFTYCLDVSTKRVLGIVIGARPPVGAPGLAEPAREEPRRPAKLASRKLTKKRARLVVRGKLPSNKPMTLNGNLERVAGIEPA